MTGLIILLCLALLVIVILQIGKVTDLAARIRGEEATERDSNIWNGRLSLLFLVLFLVGTCYSAYHYKEQMLWYGPHQSASAHGGALDRMFNITLIITGIVFVLTHIALFYFAYKYKGVKGKRATFQAHDDKLERIWTAIPAVTMALLVIGGLDAWNEVMADVKEGEDYMEIEASGYQFAWDIRYTGADGKLGERNYKLINAKNPLGQNWSDAKNADDFIADEIVLPVNKKVRVRITSKDVLHNFYLPHFRVKMDAIPGIPTYFVFTPTKTTEQYRQMLKGSEEYQKPSDPKDPTSAPRWQTFNYELACAELCGKGHYSMRKIVKIVSQAEYDKWLANQKSFYGTNVRNTEDDPFKGKALPADLTAFSANIEKAITDTAATNKTLTLDYVTFETGSAKLTSDSKGQLDALADALNKHPQIAVEVAGHTDNIGDPAGNKALSAQRATAVKDYLATKGVTIARMRANGYGDSKPKESNDSPEGRAKNRRTEFTILN